MDRHLLPIRSLLPRACVCVVSQLGPLLGSLLLGGLLLGESAAWAQRPATSERASTAHSQAVVPAMNEDAELTDVMMLDPERAWAVGDRGVIWHTEDGGKSWLPQASQVNCRLESIWFSESRRGWAAGGFRHPLSEHASGVLLVTKDAGKSWSHDPKLELPPLKQVRISPRGRGWAVGSASRLYDSGALVTEDAGRSWRALIGQSSQSWLAADLNDAARGALVGPQGSIATVRDQKVESSRTSDVGLRQLHRVQFAETHQGWLCGDGGLILTSDDQGRSWQLPEGQPSGDSWEQFDWHALAVRGPHVWIAGEPGTRVLHSRDGGKTWQAFSTGQALPIFGLSFVDEQHGMAVGALGTILATKDGGKTWHVSRSGGKRAAVAAMFAHAEDVPLELLARLAGNEGYLTLVDLVANEEAATPDALVDRAARIEQAATTLGAAATRTAWRFPQRAPGVARTQEDVIASWDRVNDGHSRELMLRELVGRLRIWRPDVLFTYANSSRLNDPVAGLVHTLVLQATASAADATQYADQITEMGLEPWQVKKVYGRLPDSQSGDVILSSGELAMRMGGSLADLTAEPHAVVRKGITTSLTEMAFRLHLDTTGSDRAARDFMTGVRLPAGSGARRRLEATGNHDVDQLRQVAQKHRTVETILQQADQGVISSLQLQGMTRQLVDGLDERSTGQVLLHLADRYFHQGQGELAAETCELFVRQHPNHPLAPGALTWLVQYWSSSETAWRSGSNQRVVRSNSLEGPAAIQQAGAVQRALSAQQASATSPVDTTSMDEEAFLFGPEEKRRDPILPGRIEQVNGPVTDQAIENDRRKKAIELAKLIQSQHPSLYAEPKIRFPLAVSQRHQGFQAPVDRYWLSFSRDRIAEPWHAAGTGERWLAAPEGVAPKVATHARVAFTKPHLDGVLDDSVWRTSKPMLLQSPARDDQAWPAAARIAYDAEFMYLAVECRKPPELSYTEATRPRTRDANLTDYDRVEFYIDLDRDYTSYYRLVVDSRGWAHDSCWDDTSWNPDWFVASTQNDERWTVEAAIPLDQLTGTAPSPQTVWALGVQRLIPGRGMQSWTQPAAAEVIPQAFGYLIFNAADSP